MAPSSFAGLGARLFETRQAREAVERRPGLFSTGIFSTGGLRANGYVHMLDSRLCILSRLLGRLDGRLILNSRLCMLDGRICNLDSHHLVGIVNGRLCSLDRHHLVGIVRMPSRVGPLRHELRRIWVQGLPRTWALTYTMIVGHATEKLIICNIIDVSSPEAQAAQEKASVAVCTAAQGCADGT